MACAALVSALAVATPAWATSPGTLALPATGASIDLPSASVETAPVLSSRQAKQLAAMLADAQLHGLALADLSPTLRPDADNPQLIAAALSYARAVHSGQLASSDYLREWGLRAAPYDPAPAFYRAVTQDELKRWIASLPPPYAGYDRLRRALARYRAIAADGGWSQLSGGEDLVMGARGKRVIELRKRPHVEDPDTPVSGEVFDRPLLDAVRRAQRRYGLDPTGTVAGLTRAALNVPVKDRIGQIVANMERWRWLPEELPRARIQVNIAAAVLTVFDGDAPVMSMRAVTGRPGDETPMLQSQIHSIVIDPPWNVPASIVTRELMPKEAAHPGYLKRNGFKVIQLADGGTRLQQAAGTQSALGRYKFDFDNPYSVYLHDTPSQGTFARYSRLASHGCVRLERPADLAELLLKADPRWSPDAIRAAVARNDTVRVRLPSPEAVYLLYWTAFAGEDGPVSFRPDPYGWDTALAAKIDARAGTQQLTSR